ncbi:beta-lactamase [Sulfolobus acidocaldarius SUSAZ]|nr:beta-lactamase [Sulfolobus acidocaldarius SUSAZ]
MLFRQLISRSGGCLTYVIGCTQAGELIIIDPKIDLIEELMNLSELYDMKISYIIDTHTHADHLSGAKKLSEMTRANVYMHESTKVKFAQKVKDNEEIKVGNVKIKFLYTPGHTPDSVSIIITDLRRGEEPWAVLTGDTLFVGGIGRIDIVGENSAEQLFYSLQKIKVLPDYVEVFPAHTSGSACGFGISGKPSSTIGFEKKYNKLFNINNKEEFINSLNSIKLPRPKEFDEIIMKNIEGDF